MKKNKFVPPNANSTETKTILLSEILCDEEMQIRCGTDPDTVTQYQEAMRDASNKFLPVVVFTFPGKPGFVLADGFHRVQAAKANGLDQIEAEIRSGNRSDALRFALSVNSRHGRRMTNEDKRRAVEIALREWPNVSDAELARWCGVSHPLVAQVRLTVLPETVTGSPRIGKDGKRRVPPPRAAKGVLPAGSAAKALPNHKTGTAPCIRQSSPPSRRKAEPTVLEMPIGDETFGIQTAQKSAYDERKQVKEATKDETGVDIPPAILPLWERMSEAQELLTCISSVRSRLKHAQDNQDPLFVEVDFSGSLAHLNQVYVDLKRAKPFAICPTCGGKLMEGCLTCKQRGFVSEFYWKTFVPEETRKMRGNE